MVEERHLGELARTVEVAAELQCLVLESLSLLNRSIAECTHSCKLNIRPTVGRDPGRDLRHSMRHTADGSSSRMPERLHLVHQESRPRQDMEIVLMHRIRHGHRNHLLDYSYGCDHGRRDHHSRGVHLSSRHSRTAVEVGAP